ncbi:MAG: DUF86 domain-containing protein [Deltaproteobacteria bacterium]|nr:DUF86 domain-containing protein [Deltaproteobacteria bacterium]MBW2198844.1 DUF86 domain-containing protein [Deltaproteobacteria bacterium]
MVDKILVLRKLSELDQYLLQINEYSGITISEYSGDWKTQRVVDRTLQMMIETCLDISGHIISDEEYRVPENYADIFKVLQENGIINESLLDALIKMAKFRNIVVHHYDKIDAAIVISILSRNLEDFNHFKNAVVSYLKSKKDEQ